MRSRSSGKRSGSAGRSWSKATDVQPSRSPTTGDAGLQRRVQKGDRQYEAGEPGDNSGKDPLNIQWGEKRTLLGGNRLDLIFLLNKIHHAGKGSLRCQKMNRMDSFPYSLIHSVLTEYSVLCWALRMVANTFPRSSSSVVEVGKNRVLYGLWYSGCCAMV